MGSENTGKGTARTLRAMQLDWGQRNCLTLLEVAKTSVWVAFATINAFNEDTVCSADLNFGLLSVPHNGKNPSLRSETGC